MFLGDFFSKSTKLNPNVVDAWSQTQTADWSLAPPTVSGCGLIIYRSSWNPVGSKFKASQQQLPASSSTNHLLPHHSTPTRGCWSASSRECTQWPLEAAVVWGKQPRCSQMCWVKKRRFHKQIQAVQERQRVTETRGEILYRKNRLFISLCSADNTTSRSVDVSTNYFKLLLFLKKVINKEVCSRTSGRIKVASLLLTISVWASVSSVEQNDFVALKDLFLTDSDDESHKRQTVTQNKVRLWEEKKKKNPLLLPVPVPSCRPLQDRILHTGTFCVFQLR